MGVGVGVIWRVVSGPPANEAAGSDVFGARPVLTCGIRRWTLTALERGRTRRSIEQRRETDRAWTVSPRRRVLYPLPGAPPLRTTRPCTAPEDSLGWVPSRCVPRVPPSPSLGEICPRQLYVICHRLRGLRDQCICADAALFLAAQPRRQLRGDEQGNPRTFHRHPRRREAEGPRGVPAARRGSVGKSIRMFRRFGITAR